LKKTEKNLNRWLYSILSFSQQTTDIYYEFIPVTSSKASITYRKDWLPVSTVERQKVDPT